MSSAEVLPQEQNLNCRRIVDMSGLAMSTALLDLDSAGLYLYPRRRESRSSTSDDMLRSSPKLVTSNVKEDMLCKIMCRKVGGCIYGIECVKVNRQDTVADKGYSHKYNPLELCENIP